jgi:hypothetical protein
MVMGRRGVAGLVVLAAAALAPSGVARADPAGPTDYETTIVSVTPPTDAIDVAVIGGDSFLELTVGAGTEVVVLGYQNEPYLRFRGDGVVEENRRSPTTYLNADRYGSDEPPPGADAALPPDWQPVGSGGRHAWHDHRAHWMDRSPPTTGSPGSEILAATVPLTVNGAPVDVAVSVVWLPAPSRTPLVVGAVVGGGLVVVALVLRRRLAWALVPVAAAAAGIGWWQYASLPAETGPLAVWWVLPAVSVACAVVAVVLRAPTIAYAFALLAALELAVWVFLRRDAGFRALIPTDAPFWLDRAVMAASGVVAAAVAVGAAIAMFRLPARR